jgi:hypothetical protein
MILTLVWRMRPFGHSAGFVREGYRGRERRFLLGTAGRGLSSRDDGRTLAIARRVSSDHEVPPGISASGIHRGAKPVSQCLGFGRQALRRNGRTATEARVRSPQWEFSFSG